MAKRGGVQPGAGRPCIYPWEDYQVGGSFIIPVGPDDTGANVQHRLGSQTYQRRKRHGERWTTRQLYKAVKVTRIA